MEGIINILLADDSVDEHFLFVHTLKSIDRNVRVQTVLNGVELVKLLNTPGAVLPDLLFLDLNMPLKNGKEALMEIKKNEKLSGLSVVIYSTSDEKRDIDETFALGANVYVRKPQDYIELEKTLGRLIDQYRHEGLPRYPLSRFVFSTTA